MDRTLWRAFVARALKKNKNNALFFFIFMHLSSILSSSPSLQILSFTEFSFFYVIFYFVFVFALKVSINKDNKE